MSFISVWLRNLQHRATARDQVLSQVWAFAIGVPRERRLSEAGGWRASARRLLGAGCVFHVEVWFL